MSKVIKNGIQEQEKAKNHKSRFSNVIMHYYNLCFLCSHVTHLYSDGDVCDVTNNPRNVRVKFRYVCNSVKAPLCEVCELLSIMSLMTFVNF